MTDRALWFFPLALLALGGVSCRTDGPDRSGGESAAVPSAAPRTASGRKQFGAPIQSKNEKPLGDVLRGASELGGQTVVVEGRVRRACTRKGCWMELAESSDPAQPGCRVTFRDYGFFVPTNSAGSKARIEASVESARVAPATVQHLESEGAVFASREADGSAREVRLVANGVELWR